MAGAALQQCCSLQRDCILCCSANQGNAILPRKWVANTPELYDVYQSFAIVFFTLMDLLGCHHLLFFPKYWLSPLKHIWIKCGISCSLWFDIEIIIYLSSQDIIAVNSDSFSFHLFLAILKGGAERKQSVELFMSCIVLLLNKVSISMPLT